MHTWNLLKRLQIFGVSLVDIKQGLGQDAVVVPEEEVEHHVWC